MSKKLTSWDVFGLRRCAMVLITLLGAAAVISACSSSSNQSQPPSSGGSSVKPVKSFSGPANIIAMSQISSQNTAWLLAGTQNAENIRTINLANGNLGNPIGVSLATSIAQSVSGLVAVGEASPATGSGAVQFFSISGSQLSIIPVAEPVVEVQPISDGTTFFVLEHSRSGAVSIQEIDTNAGRVIGNTIPLAGDVVAFAVSGDGSTIFALEANGNVDELNAISGQVSSTFPVGSAVRQIEINSSNTTLYVLKCPGAVCNVSQIDAVGHTPIAAVMPAPANTVGMQISLDNTEIWDAVGAPTYGNIQAFSLTGS